MKSRLIKLAILFASFLLADLAIAEDKKTEEPATTAPTAGEPFAFADFTWLNGNSRQTTSLLETKYFTGEFLFDGNYIYDFARPSDHTLSGSTNAGRTQEFQVEQLGIGGDFHYDNVHARVMTQFGMYSTMTPRNDASPARGQWDMANAYRYLSEAYGGYHWNVWNGINLDFGIFMSYIGLCSYYNYENWIYQMSYVSANTPWFFNGARLQIFPTDKLKLELWFINGWQSYGTFNDEPGIGFEVLYRPTGNLSLVSNNYIGNDTYGTNTPGDSGSRTRVHTDNSVQVKYYDKSGAFFDKAAFSFTVDAGCESGAGVKCHGGNATTPSQYFMGFMLYNRFWFDKDQYAITLGGGAISNPGRYLVLLPPINGATAATGAAPYFSTAPGTTFRAWDATVGFDYMPSQLITYRAEVDHRHANVPYFAGGGGMTPQGGNTTTPSASFTPDLRKDENRINLAMMVRF